MSGPPGRSATVTSLSGRVNALKFMQRASPTSSPSTPSRPTAPATVTATATATAPATASSSPAASSSVSIPASPSIGTRTAEEEQWSLSPAAIAKLRVKAQQQSHTSQTKTTDQENTIKSPRFEHEAGFDAWLIARDSQQQIQQSGPGTSKGHRQTFGVLGKRKQDESGEAHEHGHEQEQEQEQEQEGSGQDEVETDHEADLRENTSTKRFLKPGSLKQGHSQQEASSSSSKKARNSWARARDQDKVVFARKRGGKLGISGGRR